MANNSLSSPGVFRGQARLATVQDLASLKEYIESLLTGPLMELSSQGYIPWVYNESGHLDVEYLFPELISRLNEGQGVDIMKDGLKFADGVTSIDINGKYVTLSVDENGALTMTIDEPKVAIPSFNEANHFNSALVKFDSDIVTGMIIPDRTGMAFDVYGDWEVGQVVSGFNWNGEMQHDFISLSTYGPVFASSTNTYFEVTIMNGEDTVFSTFKSDVVKSSTKINQKLQGTGYNVNIYIDDFKEESVGYSFKPRFDIDLIRIIGEDGGRFKIKIVHYDGAGTHTFISNEYLYNRGVVPTIGSTSIQLITDSSSSNVKYRWCSGLKYVANGNVVVLANNISNLNNMAAVENQLSYDFDVLTIAEDSPITENNNSLAINNSRCSFAIRFDIAKEVLNTEVISGFVSVRNAFAESTKMPVGVNILINSVKYPKTSDTLHEYFSDEQFRVLSNFAPESDGGTEYSTLMPWDSTASLIEYDSGKGLQVIPGKGLVFPYGNWSSFVPQGPNYENQANERFFARVFTGNSKVKFGGTFVFEGLPLSAFYDDRLSIIISPSYGEDWYDLKSIRNVESAIIRMDGTSVSTIGVMTDAYEKDGNLYVEWAYPISIASNQPLYFKLGMKYTYPYCIKSVTLLNTDLEEGW